MQGFFVSKAALERQQVSRPFFLPEPTTHDTTDLTKVYRATQDVDDTGTVAQLLETLPIESMYLPMVPKDRQG